MDLDYSLSEFFEYMKPANLAYLERTDSRFGQPRIFWNQEYDESQELGRLNRFLLYQPSISEKIKHVLGNLLGSSVSPLIQFWAPKMRGNRRFLTTYGQPFGLPMPYKKNWYYIKQCMRQEIYISEEGDEKEEGKELLGPIGRAFVNRLPESTPNVKYYSLREFPLRDHACLADVSSLTALPVFEDHDMKNCVGVLELVDCSLLEFDICEQELKVSSSSLICIYSIFRN